jgi:sortase B
MKTLRARHLILPIAILSFGIAGLILFGLLVVDRQSEYAIAQEQYDDLEAAYVRPTWDPSQDDVTTESDGTQSPATPPLSVDDTPVTPASEVDLAALAARNPDCVGWIEIPDTVVSYPVMQSTNNDAYLYRTFEGTHLFSGSIFMDFRSSAAADGFNTIVFGHNMRDGSMFAVLNSYLHDVYLNNHPYVYLHTTAGTYTYRVLQARETNVDDMAYQCIAPDDAARQAFYAKLGEDAPDYSADAHFLTLSTCADGLDHQARTIVTCERLD